MARARDGHADLNDVYDRLGRVSPIGTERRLDLVVALLQSIARKLEAKVPVGIWRAVCAEHRQLGPEHLQAHHTRCFYSEPVLLHEGEEMPEQCPKCGGALRIEG